MLIRKPESKGQNVLFIEQYVENTK